jgi:glycosyltransferase involved in cell wall biosynthesis
MSRRVLAVFSSVFNTRGGIQRFNQLFLRALDRLAPELDFECTVLSQDDADADYEREGRPWSHLGFVAGGGMRSTSLKTIKRCAGSRPDLLLIGHLGMSPLGWLCRPFVRLGYGVIVHGREAWTVPRRSRRLAVRKAARVFSVSDYTARELARESGLQMERVRILPNALSPGLDEVEQAPAEREGGPLELLSVARLVESEAKGVDTVLAVLPGLVERFPDLRYRIVGAGSGKPVLIELARELGLEDRVVFEEGISDDDLVDRYRRCSVFVLPSGQEGFGIVFLEAMRFGKPCIGGNAGGTPEVIDEGTTGLLVPYADHGALASSLERLLADAELRRRMGEAGRRRVRERFTYPRLEDNLRRYLTEWLD